MEKQPNWSEDELTQLQEPAKLDVDEYRRSELIPAHLKRLHEYLVERNGRASLHDVLDDFAVTLDLSPEQVGALLDAGWDHIRMTGLNSAVTIVP